MGLKAKRRLIAGKLETTYGVYSSPTGSNALVVSNLDVSPMEATTVERDIIRPYFGQAEKLMTEYFAKLSFEIEVGGHTGGVAGAMPAIDALLQVCGFHGAANVADTTYDYNPITDGIPSMSFAYNVDGVLHKITGARGTFSVDFSVKGIPKFKFELTGLHNAPTDTAAFVPDFSKFSRPQVVNTQNTSNFSLLGFAGALEQFSFALNNPVQYISLVGKEYVDVLDRKATGTATFEATTVAEKDFWSAAKNQVSGAMTLTHGNQAGNIVDFSFPNVLLDSPKYKESNNVMMITCGVSLMPTTGNDEISIKFK